MNTESEVRLQEEIIWILKQLYICYESVPTKTRNTNLFYELKGNHPSNHIIIFIISWAMFAVKCLQSLFQSLTNEAIGLFRLQSLSGHYSNWKLIYCDIYWSIRKTFLQHLTSGVWKADCVFILCCAMKRIREFVSGEPRTPMLDLRLAFICARRDLSAARRTVAPQ